VDIQSQVSTVPPEASKVKTRSNSEHSQEGLQQPEQSDETGMGAKSFSEWSPYLASWEVTDGSDTM